MTRQLTSYLEDNHLYEPLQSAYKKSHSTEAALIKDQNDIVTAIDSGHSVILVLLDLSAAFDTVHHRILIRKLSTRFGIRNRALDWFVSYLSDCTQYVKVKDTSSPAFITSHSRCSSGFSTETDDIAFSVHFSTGCHRQVPSNEFSSLCL